ncbi:MULTISPECIES: hypothetical protein [Williamsia]|nr:MULTISPECIES: hypothetical protein [Williamsia]
MDTIFWDVFCGPEGLNIIKNVAIASIAKIAARTYLVADVRLRAAK